VEEDGKRAEEDRYSGISRTGLPEQGARTSVHCATAPELAGVSGRFYDDCREREPSQVATPELGRLLWERSMAWTAA
jgi:hypothetical protein